MYELLRRVLFRLPAEQAHHVAFRGLRLTMAVPGLQPLARALLSPRDPALRVHALGTTFAGPLGLAAGFDKNAEGADALGALGFSHVEVGTVTGQGQPGNPQPRLFRLPADRAVINRMGFNNDGAMMVAQRLARRMPRVPLGINIGKTKQVDEANAGDDYELSTRLLGAHAGYFVINVSSPNTPKLRDLQRIEALRPLASRVRATLDCVSPTRRVPLLIKIAPDLADEDIDNIADLALELGIDGLIATNTTISRAGLSSSPAEVDQAGAGGLSGAPLTARSLSVIARLYQRVGSNLCLVGVGGIRSADDAWERICAGATLIQLYTGFIYEGPLVAHRIHQGLAAKLREHGLGSIMDAVGRNIASQTPRS